jgi:glycosyltransferase involved in cell wall biosynthesis
MHIAYLVESTELSGGTKVALLQAEALARRGHRVTVVSPGPEPLWFRRSRASFERASFRESRELARAQIRVATFWTTVAPALASASGPVFHLCQGYEGGFSFYSDRREAIEAAYRAPTRKLVISATLAARLDALGFGPAENIGQAFDPRGFFPLPDGVPGRPPVLLLVGPFGADVKGIAVALEGLLLWRRRGGVFRLRRVSTEPPASAEEALDLVEEYHHGLDPDRMPFVYRACDLFLGPSRPEEGFGLPTLEAFACGLPCVLSDTPSHREFAGDAAWYFADGDAEALVRAIPLAATPEARARARREGPAVAARFDPDRVAVNLEQSFLRALSQEGASV